MKQLLVDEIVQEGTLTRGYAALNDTVESNLEAIYSVEQLRDTFNTIDASPLGRGVFIDRYCQFIIYVRLQLRPEIDLGMVIIDCNGDLDTALDEFLMYRDNSWDESCRKRFMELFYEIQNDKMLQKSEMVFRADTLH